MSFFRKKNSEDYIKLLVKKGMSVKKAKGEIRYSWSFYYNLFYTKTAKKIAHDYLKSIREKVFRVKGSDWKPPSVIRKNERKFIKGFLNQFWRISGELTHRALR